ncbi:CLUMA_CG009870, isoform A [Clunio marinus]|uniref:CLUMA_CG009870, isoform A n=1 Tax=Clunio marinus TaxID=568069 RepID=A0A1J1IEI2_9DIPT|nr:CLUMA_CG009870, isoform A [Clunio marinus]
MSEEFALCWNNFTDNITAGFHSLLFRGDLCDVTLAAEGQLLKAHKVVLSICSPYFQEMFVTNPCQHPIIILKDTKAKLVLNLLEFMYQGAVNVKQSELSAFMKIAETLQIKGLTTNPKENKRTSSGEKSKEKFSDQKSPLKRCNESPPTTENQNSNKQQKIQNDVTDLTIDDDDESQVDEQFNVSVPEISMVELGLDSNPLSSKSHDSSEAHLSFTPTTLKISSSQSLGSSSFDTKSESKDSENRQPEIPNEVPSSGANITMLSSTSLLHGNCIFNRNNTVATQAGLKTYWLCKSYRISMCKARCITHQGKVISATGVHNHSLHMKNKYSEIPPGHTPNIINSTQSINDFKSNISSIVTQTASSQQHQQQHLQLQSQQGFIQPYHYFSHMMEPTNEQIYMSQINSNQHFNPTTSESKLSFLHDPSTSTQGQFKMEDI